MRTELLAPAGSIAAMHAALVSGADAVYIGGDRFGARAYADNPHQEDLLAAIDLAHRLGRKLYMTVNTLLRDGELEEELADWMRPYYEEGLDGVIVQDFGVADLFRREFPELALHASTQMAVTGSSGSRLLGEKGFTRVVPARELSLPEIRRIHEETGMEIEAFIHGAMCYSYSGMCLMSSLIGGRSGNRGRCAGVCRLPFEVWQNGRKINGGRSAYPLNMKDMCTLELLPDLIHAGIFSFKIEGRMKRPEYTAGVVSVYRKYLDLCAEEPDECHRPAESAEEQKEIDEKHRRWTDANYHVERADLQRLWDLFNRDGFNRGYYMERNGRDMIALRNEKLSDVRQKKAREIYAEIQEELSAPGAARRLQRGVRGDFTAEEGRPALLRVELVSTAAGAEEGSASVTAEVAGDVVQAARKSPLTIERIRRQLTRTGTSAYYFEELNIHCGGNIFMPVQELNTLRRSAFAALEEKVREQYHRTAAPLLHPADTAVAGRSGGKRTGLARENTLELWVLPETGEQLRAVLDEGRDFGLYLPLRELKDCLDRGLAAGRKYRVALPCICREINRSEIAGAMDALLSGTADACGGIFDGFLVRNLEEAGMLHDRKAEWAGILDSTVYTMNSRAENFFARAGFRRNTMSLELNVREMHARENSSSEIVLYGRAPMMISAQCLQKTLNGCTHSFETLELRDRRHAVFPVQCCCDDCYNVIWNSLPTSLLAERRTVERLGCVSGRIHLTVENEEETRAVLRAFSEVYEGHEEAELSFEVTRGHFRRGVE